jgi:hypothetical protein
MSAQAILDESANGTQSFRPAPADGGKLIVLTAPLTESIDHAGYFIQMGMASMPIWLEGVLNRKYPHWREVEYNKDGSARYVPAGLRLLEASLLRKSSDQIPGLLQCPLTIRWGSPSLPVSTPRSLARPRCLSIRTTRG